MEKEAWLGNVNETASPGLLWLVPIACEDVFIIS